MLNAYPSKAKLGLLPKQRIALDGKPPRSPPLPSVPSAVAVVPGPDLKKLDQARVDHKEDESDEDLTYTRNPFEADD